jgi:hypothetical protein
MGEGLEIEVEVLQEADGGPGVRLEQRALFLSRRRRCIEAMLLACPPAAAHSQDKSLHANLLLLLNARRRPRRQGEEGLWLQPPAPLTLRLPAAAVLAILDADYGQRQDERGVHNPHGEHAHDVWALRAPPASARVFGRRRRETSQQ